MMLQSLSLNGAWTLKSTKGVEVPEIPAQVPGNIELDLQKAGILPDLFYGRNETLLRPYEFNDWEYSREFSVPSDFPAEVDLKCEGIDCVAEIRINDEIAGACDNAFIGHVFPVGRLLKRGKANDIRVVIKSPILAVKDIPLDHQAFALYRNFESLNLRKPAHSYGWDITPRMMLGGIFRSLSLIEHPAHRLTSWFMDSHPYTTAERGVVACSFSMETALESWTEFELEVTGRCGDSVFEHHQSFNFPAASFFMEIPRPKFWNPAGYGEPNIYEVEIRLSHQGQLLCTHHCTFGLRLVSIEVDEDPEHLKFQITVNGNKIMAKGTNWVPTSVFHSQDNERSPRLLELAGELGCNIIRIWGGGVYETPEFYDYCDRHGIMVWQDFMIACGQVPVHPEFMEKMRLEAEAVVRELRQHPSLILWSGDNEVDVFQYEQLRGVKPSMNLITRQVFPQVLNRLDPSRFYLPSSPFVSPENEKLGRQQRDFPEQHPWGPRDYHKEPFILRIKAAMLSEIGFFGMNSRESLRKYLPEEALKKPLDLDNLDWTTHGPTGYAAWRFDIIRRNAREYFPEEYPDIQDLIDASQFVHAESFKFIIEKVRAGKWQHSGIIWWNLFDCWPQISEALVDFYFEKKPAFEFVRRSQAQPLLLCFKEWDYEVIKGMGRRGHGLVCCNDTLTAQAGHYQVTEADSGAILLEGDFAVSANSNEYITNLDVPHCEHRLWLIRWTLADGTRGANHYLCGEPPFSLAEARHWLPVIQALSCEIDWKN